MDACEADVTALMEPAVTDLDMDEKDETPSFDLLPRKLMPFFQVFDASNPLSLLIAPPLSSTPDSA